MISTKSITGLGQIMQLAFVPKDMAAAIRYWTETIGAGPFFLLRDVKVAQGRYLGQASTLGFDFAIGYWGDIQIELLRQTNDAPSVYKAHRDAGNESLHHVCILVADMAQARLLGEEKGGEVVYEGLTMTGRSPFCYLDMKGGADAPLIEMLQPAEESIAFFKKIRDAARNWDGTDPIRVVR